MYNPFIKRFLDFSLCFIGIVMLSPILLFLMIFLTVTNNGKPFFFQTRPGKNEKIFKIMKFKSMNDKKDENGELLPFEQRITRVGKFIRKYSLDEIPQLFNVLKGDMSLIGPRPLLIKYLPLYSDFQKQRHNVRPGITGWAQVNGRNTISWDQKFKLDVWYTENVSFKTDVKIILLTIKKVFFKEDINSGENLNMPTFTGNN
ncbi:sugar transferase [Aquimarina sp. AD10]|uniref:UDP-galactose phosphate transferase n=1 Tax=Aquimarina aggregata TaxID=1642818 RepID=A0A162CWF8_9FLAO|nr:MULTISPECIES: sugar transferase [Aquimarina]AXT59921.1 sugar transferase [Aquimarina sp. AD10]KZS42089.1 UDP-galactose phosphate transferase [Aquimarina aggregata]RKM95640.1 sugar transferase [Aquimarina sp. AD10]